MELGARPTGEGSTAFRVWAPYARSVEVELGTDHHGMSQEDGGYFSAVVSGVGVGARYAYLLDGEGPFADPASRAQPDGPFGRSAVVEARAEVPATWHGQDMDEQVICEVHVGTFSDAGTFAGVAERLVELAEDGYTTVELLPVATFPGERNWGYDGVLPFAIQHSYGGPEGLARLVEAAHRHGVGIIVDVVYNHLGPLGAPHDHFGPYRTERYSTPWGPAMNFDGPESDAVRDYFVAHASYLVGDLGVDGLRLDAVHAIADGSEVPFVAELTAAVHALGAERSRTVSVVAESAANDARVTAAFGAGGLGCDAQWDDDFHHGLRVALTGDATRSFADIGGIADLATAMTDAFVRPGAHSLVHGRRHGRALAVPIRGETMVVYAQNHDQVGNGGFGERLSATLGRDVGFVLGALVLLSPYVPLRFMGEEYGEVTPFHFFTSFGPGELAQAVRAGRAEEIGTAGAGAPDPESPRTFAASRCHHDRRDDTVGQALRAWQRHLLELRRHEPALAQLSPSLARTEVDANAAVLCVLRPAPPGAGRDVALVAHLGTEAVRVAPQLLADRPAVVLAEHDAGADAGSVSLGRYGVAVLSLG